MPFPKFPKTPAPAPVAPAAPTPTWEDILRGIDPNNWVEGLRANTDALRGFGVTPQIGSGGAYRGRLFLPGGGFLDPFSGGMGNTLGLNWASEPFWSQPGVERPSGGGGGGGAPSINPEYLAPWTKQFDFGAFQAPAWNDVLKDPGYQFRLNQSQGALEHSASARGLTHSGGTLFDIMQNAGNLASQEYGNAYGRAANTWGMNQQDAWARYMAERDAWYRNQNEPWRKIMDATGVGAGAAMG
jgi:hypothetical protein